MRRTKIVCTIGPASRSPDMLEQMIRAGTDVVRLNFSHGTQEEHAEVIASVRRISSELDRPVAILQDLAGPKIRIGAIAEGTINLEADNTFTLTTEDVPGDKERVSISYAGLPRDVDPGDNLLLSDGALELEVQETTDTAVICRVIIGGPLSSRKGITLPTRSIRAPILSDKDRDDLAFGLEQGVDYVAISFVRSAEDVETVRSFIEKRGVDVPLIAKIEKHEALQHIDRIIETVDGVMVARGDLGVEIPLAKVPLVQKRLIDKANHAGRLVITATQMLRSMVDSPRPTRAEVTDVANAILDGTDAVMLSEESAIGRYPVRAVSMMASIAEDVEGEFPYAKHTEKIHSRDEHVDAAEAVAHAVCRLAEDLGAAAIITCTTSGSTARQVARYRPGTPILAPTPNENTYHRLALAWGTRPCILPRVENTDDMLRRASEAAIATGMVKQGDTLVITAGIPLNTSGTTNLIRVLSAGGI